MTNALPLGARMLAGQALHLGQHKAQVLRMHAVEPKGEISVVFSEPQRGQSTAE